MVVKDGAKLDLVDLSSDVTPEVEASGWPRAVLSQFSLTFGQPLGQADLQSDIPHWQRHQVARNGTNLGPVDLSSDISPSRGI